MQARPLKVLLIDGSTEDLTALTASVRATLPECTLLTAADGARGLELARTKEPDVILLDIASPDADCLSVCRRLKENDRLRAIPVICLTSRNTGKEDRGQALAAGADGFLSKPLDEFELAAQIRIMVRIRPASHYHQLERQALEALGLEMEVRKQAEADLWLSEERTRQIIDHAPFGVHHYELEPGQRLVFKGANPAADAILGVSHLQFIGRTIEEAFPPLAQTDIPAAYRRVAAMGERYDTDQVDYEYGNIRGAYEVHAFQTHPNRIAVFFTDITERKRAEDALRVTQEIFDRFLANSPIYIFFKDENLRSLRLSRNFEKMLGRPLSELLNKTMDELFPSEMAKRMIADDMKILKEGRDIRVDEEFNGRFYTTIKFPILIDGKPRYLAGYTMDITERKQTEEALKESKDQLSFVLEGSQTGFWDWDIESGRVVRNARWAEMLGYTLQEIEFSTRQWTDFLHPEDRAAAWQSIQDHLEGRTPMHKMEYRMLGKDGQCRWILDQARVVKRNPEGKPLRMTGTHTDITEYKQAEKEKEEIQAQLRQAQKMESVGRLAGGVAHDFNNLLMGIMGYAELCRDAVPQDHPIRAWLDEIINDSQRSAAITRQLLAFARKQIISPKVLDLNDAVTGILNLLRRLIGEHICLTWRPGADLWQVKLDPAQIDQILTNLCINARDAIGCSGTISIETENVTVTNGGTAAHPSGVVPGAYVLLTVSDNGCGMEEKILAHVFEPFFSTKDASKGAGMGLATVYGIVKQNNGFINVYSEPGKGTTFKIYFHRVAPTVIAKSVATATKTPRGRGETILLVEDEPSLRVTYGLLLKALGYNVLSAESPAAALDLVARHPGDLHLLLTDVIMPGMNGQQLAQRLCADRPGLKILFMSGYPAHVIADQGILDPGVPFIGKPFSRDTLAVKIHELLG